MPDDSTPERLLQAAAWTQSGPEGRCGMRLSRQGTSLVLIVEGNVLQQVPETFVDACDAVLAQVRPADVIVDLRACQHLASMALAFLVHLHRASTQQGARRSILFAPNPRVLALIKLIGLIQFYIVAADEAALQALFSARA